MQCTCFTKHIYIDHVVDGQFAFRLPSRGEESEGRKAGASRKGWKKRRLEVTISMRRLRLPLYQNDMTRNRLRIRKRLFCPVH